MFDKKYLQEALKNVTEAVSSELRAKNELSCGELTAGAPMTASDIPGEMHAGVVEFAKRAALQPRHLLLRREEEHDEPPFPGWSLALASIVPVGSERRSTTPFGNHPIFLPRPSYWSCPVMVDVFPQSKCCCTCYLSS